MKPKQDTQSKNVFTALSNEIRQKIIRELSEKPLTFMELSRSLNISTSKLNFHLKKMNAFLQKEVDKYQLTEVGRTTYALIQNLEPLPAFGNHVKIASIGMLIEPIDIDFNIREALKSADFVSSQEVNLICLPFLNITQSITVEKIINPFLTKAKNLEAHISFGLFEMMNGKNYYSTVLVTPDGEFKVYRSIHKSLFTSYRINTGDDVVVTDTRIGKIGLACGDEYVYPELFRILKIKGADYTICPAFGTQEKFRKIIQSLLIARTIENQLIVAFSSSSLFPKEPFGVVYSPNQATPLTDSIGNSCVATISLNDIKRNREYFNKFFPRRTELYQELEKKDTSSNATQTLPAVSILFPMTKIIRKYKVNHEEFVQFEEINTFEKPTNINIPMPSYMRFRIPLKEAKDVEWFDDFGQLPGIITKKEPIIEYLVRDRNVIMPGKSYSIGVRCKTSDPIKVRGTEVILTPSFEDYNKFSARTSFKVDEFETEVLIGPKFDFITSKPVHSATKESGKTKSFIWKWIKPTKVPMLKIRLRKINPKHSMT